MLLVNIVPNPKRVATKLQKLYSRKVSINVAHRRTNKQHRRRHQSGKTYSLVKMKFCRDKNLEIGVSTKLIVTARIRGNVLLKMSKLHILKIEKRNLKKNSFEKKLLKTKFENKFWIEKFEK